MKTMNHLILCCAIGLSLFFVGCSKDQETGTMTVKFTGNSSQKQVPQFESKSTSALDAIYVDVKGCEILYNAASSPDNWVALNANAGIYNLFDLNDDATVVLVDETTMPAGEVGQMRLILGPNNSIVFDGTSYPLAVPSAEQSGLKINLNESVHFVNHITVVLDFDPDHQIVELGNGGYILKPVIGVDVIYQD